MFRNQALAGALAFLCTVLGASSAPVVAQTEPSSATPPATATGEPGIRLESARGITENTAAAMQRQAVTPPHGPRPEHELEMPDRSNLPQNSDAPATSRFPAGGAPARPDHTAIHTPALSFNGATLTDTGAFPPDSMGTVGPTQYIVFVNGRIRSFTKAGTADGVIDTDPDVFFAPVMTPVSPPVVLNFSSDPQIRYDRFTARWYMSIIDVPCTNVTCTTTAANRWMVAVSDAASNGTITASTVWTKFQFQADPGTNFCDYPSLGVDVNAFYVGCNMFTSAGSFVGTNGYVIQKASVLGAGPPVVTMFPNMAAGAGAGPEAPRGVDNFDAGATEGYFVGPDNATFSTIMFRRISNPGSLTPTISANIGVTVPTTTVPNPVTHLGNTGGNNGRLDSLDDRFFQAMIRNGHLWAAHNFRVGPTGIASTTATARNATRWYDFQNLTTTPTLNQAGTVFDSAATLAGALQYWIPSITATGQGHAVLGFSMAGNPSGATPAYVGRLAGDALGTMNGPPGGGAVQIGVTTANYNPPSDPGGGAGRRWGDYSFTVVDPLDDMTVWTIQEFNQALNSDAVRVGKLIAPPPATPTCSATPINFNGGTGDVVITATSASGSGFYDPGANLPPPALPFNHLSATVTGATVNSATYNSPTQVTLNITATSGGLRDVTITNPDGQSVAAPGCINVIPVIVTHTVTPSVSGGNGAIAPSTPQTVNDGDTTSFTLTPNAGFHINTVGGTCGGSLAGNVFTTAAVLADCTVIASFAIDAHTVTPSVSGGNGTITPSTPQSVNDGATSSFTLTPDSGFHIDTVGGTCGGSLVGNVFTTAPVLVDCTVIASFAINAHIVTPSVGTPSGTITPSTPQSVNEGGTISFTLTPDSGFHIDTVGGTCGGSLAGNVYTTSAVTVDCSVVANFAAGGPPVCSSGGQVEVQATAGTPGPTGYTTLKGAFDAINAGTHQGTIGIAICADTSEGASAALNASGTGSSAYTSIAINPAGGAARTVGGAIAAGSPLVDFVGAKNVTIDGLNAGGNALTLSNTTASAIASTSTIRFINGASNNTVTRTNVLGSSSSATATAGGNILFSTSTIAGGNSNNTISGNNIGPAGANLMTKGVMGLGTAANPNTGNVIDGNAIFDFFSPTASVSGVSVQANDNNWAISNNRLYQTAARTFTGTGLRYAGITLSASTGAFTVTGNTIGFGAADGSGTTAISGSTNTFRGIDAASTSTTVATSIQGNVISGISQTTASTGTGTSTQFIGMMLGSTDGLFNVGDVDGNTLGSLDGSSTIVINASAGAGTAVGIYNFSFFATNISNNAIGSITIQGTATGVGFRGILVNTASAATALATISNNTIANITDSEAGSNSVYAIQTSLPPVSITGNVIRNIAGNSTAASLIVSRGILIATTSTGASLISRNVVQSLSNNSGAASNSIYAIYGSFGSAANVVERNFVHSLSINSTAATSQLVGILAVAGTGTYQNNMVRLGIDAAGASIAPGYAIYGMFEIAGTNNIYDNSVYVGGSGVASGSSTFSFVSNVTTGTRNYIGNIFWNARSNGSGAGKNYAIALSGMTGVTTDYNDLYATGVGGFTGAAVGVDQLTLANWQTATTQDAHSIAADPLFAAPAGTAATVDLHLQVGSPAFGAGTPIAAVTNDFDGDPRSATTPTIGADESIAGPGSHTVTPSVGTPSGTIAPSTPQAVNDGDTASFTLTPDAGFAIDSVGGTCGGTLNVDVFTTNPVTADCTVIANFVAVAVTHTVTPSIGTPSGSIAPSTPQIVLDGSTTAFTLTPDVGFQIDNVGGTCAGALVGNVFTTAPVTADCSVIANFTANPEADVTPGSLTFNVGTGGSASTPLHIANTGGGTLTWSIAEAATSAPNAHRGTVQLTPVAMNPVSASTGPVEFAQSDLAVGLRGPTINIVDDTQIAQMADNTPASLNGLSCGQMGVNTSDNSWWRRFYFSEHPAVGASASISAVTIAVEDGPSIPVTVNIYTIDHSVAIDTIPTGQLTLIGSGSGVIGGTLASVTIPVSGTVDDTVGKDLVVEYHIDGAATPFFPGGNPSAQTHSTFLSSAACGITTPTDPSSFGFPNFHIIMVVDVADGAPPSTCANPADVPWLAATPTSGAVAGGDSQDSTIDVDATSLGAGTYSANLCVTTNDPTHALVEVPVSLTVAAAPTPPTVAKSFSPTSVSVDTDSTLTVTLGNTNASAATLTSALTDAFPSGLVVSTPDNAATTCPGGVVTANPGDGSFTLSSGTQIPANGTCTITLNVRSSTAGSYVNTIPAGALETDDGDNATAATATLTVTPVLVAPTLDKSFSPDTVIAGAPSLLTLTLGNSNATTATLTASLTDTFPAGLVVDNPSNATTSCPGGTVTATPGTGSVSLSAGAQIPPNNIPCSVKLSVRAATAGSYVNTVAAGALQTDAGNNASPATATLTVTPVLVAPTLAKAFAPASVIVGTPSTLTLTLGNANASSVILTSALTDTLPSGLVVANPANALTTCPSGTVAATSGTGTVTLGNGAQIPANGTCTVTVSVQSAATGSYVNTIPAGALQTNAGNNATAASATLTVTPVLISDRIFCDGFDGVACADSRVGLGALYYTSPIMRMTLSHDGFMKTVD